MCEQMEEQTEARCGEVVATSHPRQPGEADSFPRVGVTGKENAKGTLQDIQEGMSESVQGGAGPRARAQRGDGS